MNFAKTIFTLSTLILGLANAQVSCDTAIYCDASEFPGPKEAKLVQTYRGGYKVVLSLKCKGDGVAYACIDEDAPDGLVGAMISTDDGVPMCETLYYVYGTAKHYQTTPHTHAGN